MFSIAVADIYDIDANKIQEGLSNFELSKNRLDVIKTDKYSLCPQERHILFRKLVFHIFV